jgi:hypothetical protein
MSRYRLLPSPAQEAVLRDHCAQARYVCQGDRHGAAPGAELVAEAWISLGADPYLADYLIDGRAVLPAAMGLER